MLERRDTRFIPELGFDRDKVLLIHKANNADHLIDHVLARLEESGKLKPCANKPSSRQKRRATLETMLANLVLSTSDDFWLNASERQRICYSRRDGHYSNHPVGSSFSHCEQLLITDALEAVGLLHHEKADRSISGVCKSSSFAATEEMLAILQEYPVSVLELSFNPPFVIVKNEEKKVMKKLPRDLTKLVAPLEEQMRKIREHVSWQGIELIDDNCKDVTLDVLAKVIERNNPRGNAEGDQACSAYDTAGDDCHYEALAIALRQRTHLYRAYNNGSLKQGGRLFGHWIQRISKEDRKWAVLNGRQTIGLDYSAVQPHIIYAVVNKTAPDGGMYELDGISDFNIDVAKKVMLVMINCKSRSGAVQAMLKLDRERAADGKSWGLTRDVVTQYIDGLAKKHHAISDYFFSGFGLKAQNIESNIAVRVLLKLIDQDIACIPIHDCFVVGVQNREALARAMDEAAEEEIGRRIPWKQEY